MNASHIPVIVSAARTPIGRRGGSLAGHDASELGGLAIREVAHRAGLESHDITDVIFGNTLSHQGNVARVAALHAGLSVDVPGFTIDRQCGSGINTIGLAAQGVIAGGGIFIAGGAESMSREPFLLERSPRPFPMAPPKFLRRELTALGNADPAMGTTAENIAREFGISRAEQDEFSFESQKRMAAAVARGAFDDHLVAVPLADGSLFTRDEHPRPETSIEGLSKLRPVFEAQGTVTAGNASGINDGAAAAVVMSLAAANERGLAPLARIAGWAVAGVEPGVMGLGPVPATRKLLAQTGTTIDDYDLVELNEAFAVQALACSRELGIDPEKLNVIGGAIAHGHPIAATGTMLIAKIVSELRHRGLRKGLVTACIGGGQGIALALTCD